MIVLAVHLLKGGALPQMRGRVVQLGGKVVHPRRCVTQLRISRRYRGSVEGCSGPKDVQRLSWEVRWLSWEVQWLC